MSGPLWPTCLAIASAALEAGAVETMPGGYCRNSGTWGSPCAAKVRPTSRPTKKTHKTWIQSQEMGHPISCPKKMAKFYRDPEKGVGGLQVQPFPGAVPDGRLPGTVTRHAARLPPGMSSVLKRIRSPTRAEDAGRLGLQEKGWSLGRGRWGCQSTTSTFPKFW